MQQSVFVIGAGGHAKVVASTLRALEIHVGAFCDDDPAKQGATFCGAPVIATDRIESGQRAVIGIGSNAARQKLAARLECEWVTIVHPKAWVDPTVRLGEGTVVFAGAIIQPDTLVGRHAIINTAASVDHDCSLGDYVHVAPGVHLAGDVALGDGAFVGVGASAIPGRRIGAWATIGAGAVVIHNIEPGVTSIGVPAHPLTRKA